VLIGPGGYKGRADEEGAVEIGYAIVGKYRGQGLATEAARGLIDHAFSHEHVRRVDAHTLAEPNASVRVLRRPGCGSRGRCPIRISARCGAGAYTERITRGVRA
jgi:RimJ/RimL family protein N-acetyltransferase